jgi:hypothetical protein
VAVVVDTDVVVRKVVVVVVLTNWKSGLIASLNAWTMAPSGESKSSSMQYPFGTESEPSPSAKVLSNTRDRLAMMVATESKVIRK